MHLIDDLITVHCAHFKTCTNYWQTNEEHHKKTPPFVKCFHYVIPDPRPNKLQRKFIVFLHVLQNFWLQHQSVTSWPASTFRGHLQTPTIKRLSFSDHLYLNNQSGTHDTLPSREFEPQWQLGRGLQFLDIDVVSGQFSNINFNNSCLCLEYAFIPALMLEQISLASVTRFSVKNTVPWKVISELLIHLQYMYK